MTSVYRTTTVALIQSQFLSQKIPFNLYYHVVTILRIKASRRDYLRLDMALKFQEMTVASA